jgi:hypothetical protein
LFAAGGADGENAVSRHEKTHGYSRLCCVVMPAKLGKNGAYFAFICL